MGDLLTWLFEAINRVVLLIFWGVVIIHLLAWLVGGT